MSDEQTFNPCGGKRCHPRSIFVKVAVDPRECCEGHETICAIPQINFQIALYVQAEAEGTRPSQAEMRSQSGSCATAMPPPSLAINGSVLRDSETGKEWHFNKSADFTTDADSQPQVISPISSL